MPEVASVSSDVVAPRPRHILHCPFCSFKASAQRESAVCQAYASHAVYSHRVELGIGQLVEVRDVE